MEEPSRWHGGTAPCQKGQACGANEEIYRRPLARPGDDRSHNGVRLVDAVTISVSIRPACESDEATESRQTQRYLHIYEVLLSTHDLTRVTASPTDESYARSTLSADFTRFRNGAESSNKRPRMVSPTSIKRSLDERRNEREKKRTTRYKERTGHWSEWYHENVLNDVMADIPEDLGRSSRI